VTERHASIQEFLADHGNLARVPTHLGTATLRLGKDLVRGTAGFILPAGGQALVVLNPLKPLRRQDFGRDLVLEGVGTEGEFRITCEEVFVRRPAESLGLALISPVNRPTAIRYGSARAAKTASAMLNNFDYEDGDVVPLAGGGFTRLATPLACRAGGRAAVFHHRGDRPSLLPLVEGNPALDLTRRRSLPNVGGRYH